MNAVGYQRIPLVPAPHKVEPRSRTRLAIEDCPPYSYASASIGSFWAALYAG
jgi:hypothetical protein